MKKTALVAMSGGVDSSVAAYLLIQQGYECIGTNLKLFSNEVIGKSTEKSCCSFDDAEAARKISSQLGMPFYVLNFAEAFKSQVIDRFIDTYENGATPNPCIDCNRYIKFDRLLNKANELDISYIATGHYARVEYDGSNKRYLLKKGADCKKDQSYVLYFLTQGQLSRAIFPLGGINKTEVRDIAAKQGFANANKTESQDICFVQEGNYGDFIDNYSNKTHIPGDFVDLCGNVLGRHKGLTRYTIGQRKGLGISMANPIYVHSKCVKNNTVTLCDNEGLFSKTLLAADFNWIMHEEIIEPIRVKAKVRYNQKEEWATASPISKGQVEVTFDEPQRAIAKGQAVVLYDGDYVVGGGTIG